MAPVSIQANNPSPVAAFWRHPRFRVCLVAFDTRRGRKEGHEHEKVLAFCPPSASQGVRTAIVGLGQALGSFSSSFSPSSNSPEMKFIEADNNRWAMIEVFGPRSEDRGIWLMLVLNKSWAGPGVHNEAMHHTLTLLQAQSELLHGPLYQLVDEDPTAALFKRQIQPLVEELSRRIQSSSDSSLLPSLSNPLAIQSGLPFLQTSQNALVAAQCLVNNLMTINSGGERIVPASLVCWKGGSQPIWCSGPLSTRDCETLSQFTARALIQRPRPLASSAVEAATGAAAALPAMMMLAGAVGQGGAGGTDEGLKTLLSPQSWIKVPSSSDDPASSGPRLPSSSSPSDTGPSASYSLHPTQASAAMRAKAASSQLEGPGSFFLVPRAVSSLSSSSLIRDEEASVEETSALPTARVWLAGMQQYAHLLPYHHGPLVVLILIKDQTKLTRDAVASISQVLSSSAPHLSSLLSEEIPSKNLWHVPGYRYHVVDGGMVQATPQVKVKTLSSSALREAASTLERMRWQSSEPNLAMATRGYADASTWVVAIKEKGIKVGITTMEKVPTDRPPLPSALAHARKVFDV